MKYYIILLFGSALLLSCNNEGKSPFSNNDSAGIILPDTTQIPDDEFGLLVKYGRKLMLNTAVYIGPQGTNGKFLGNKMNCSNCHQDAGTKPFSLNLMRSHERYPQYRARENKVLTLAERVNNCVTRPHSGKPLPLDSKEMVAFLSYLKWINSFVKRSEKITGEKNLEITFPERAANPETGAVLFVKHCERCHGKNGEGIFLADSSAYQYPPLWGSFGYQPGSSMHRVIMQARWLKANMPFDLATWNKPVLTDEEALDIAAFVNDDRIHNRPNPANLDYLNPNTKPIDYGIGPFADSFSEQEHKFGPWGPIIKTWKQKGLNPKY